MKELRKTKNNPFHISCGGVVYRKNKKGQIEILLLHRFKKKNWQYDSWHLPKGTKDKNEKNKQTVAREVLEETGYKVKVLEKIGRLKSTYKKEGRLIYKTTHYFICKPIKRIKLEVTEHDKVKWIPLKKAIQLLSQFPIFEKEEEVLKKFSDLIS